jgi:hypothetical protein
MMVGTWAAAALWLLLALAIRWRAGRAAIRLRVALALAGVPLVGLLTWQAGPVPGTLGLLLGALLLSRASTDRMAQPAE